MTPEERQLITGLFDRLRGFALPQKDGEAEALINQQMGSVRDAPYMLVQSVLVQEQALEQADSRIRELEEQVTALQSAQQQRAPASGSFLGGFFGSRPAAEPDRGASVPAVGARATPPVYGDRPAWAGPQGASPQPAAPGAAPQAAGGGFLQSAMTTAAGVAGGMLAANAISSLLGGGSAHAASKPAQQTASTDAAASDTGGGGASEAGHVGDDRPDAYQEAAYEDDSGWFGDDGDELDI